jgi:hypothetical protein
VSFTGDFTDVSSVEFSRIFILSRALVNFHTYTQSETVACYTNVCRELVLAKKGPEILVISKQKRSKEMLSLVQYM